MMKATGIIRRVDDLGRIVIPKEIRRNLSIKENDAMEIFIGDNNTLVFQKYEISQDIIRSLEDLIEDVEEEESLSYLIPSLQNIITSIKLKDCE